MAIGFENLAIDLVVVDQDAEPVLHLGEHGRYRHRIEFGQLAEQAAVGGQRRGAVRAEAEDVGKQRAQGGIDGGGGRISHEHIRSEEHTSELQSLMRISYAVFCLKNKKNKYCM